MKDNSDRDTLIKFLGDRETPLTDFRTQISQQKKRIFNKLGPCSVETYCLISKTDCHIGKVNIYFSALILERSVAGY